MKIHIKDYIINALNCHRGDDLERAERVFSGLSKDALNKQYGYSGKTCQELLDSYRKYRIINDEALQAVKDL
jgi:hypothetical protein